MFEKVGGEGELNLAWHDLRIGNKVARISLVAEGTKRSAKWFSHQQWERAKRYHFALL
jgi:hypothetical protein